MYQSDDWLRQWKGNHAFGIRLKQVDGASADSNGPTVDLGEHYRPADEP